MSSRLDRLFGRYPTKQLRSAHEYGLLAGGASVLIGGTVGLLILVLIASTVSAAPDKNLVCSAWENITPSECDLIYDALTNESYVNETSVRYINTTTVQQVENPANLSPYATKAQLASLQEWINDLATNVSEAAQVSDFEMLQAEREHNLTLREVNKRYELLLEEARINASRREPERIDTTQFVTREEAKDAIEEAVEDEVATIQTVQSSSGSNGPPFFDSWITFLVVLGGGGYAAYSFYTDRTKKAKSQLSEQAVDTQAASKVSQGEVPKPKYDFKKES